MAGCMVLIKEVADKFATVDVLREYVEDTDSNAFELFIDNEELVNVLLQSAIAALKQEFLDRLQAFRLESVVTQQVA